MTTYGRAATASPGRPPTGSSRTPLDRQLHIHGQPFCILWSNTAVPLDPIEHVIFGDLNADRGVNVADLTLLIDAWGTGDCLADLDIDGVVGVRDLLLLLAAWNV